jgi:hypothetical protein
LTRHRTIDETGKYIVMLKKVKGMKCTYETLSSGLIQITVTTPLEQDEIETLVTALKLFPSTVQNYFPHNSRHIGSFLSVPIVVPF